METLKIISYTDEKYSQKHLDTLTLSIVPGSFELDKGIIYAEDKRQGNINMSNAYKQYTPKTLSFELIIDCTGVVEGTKEGDKVKDKMEDLEKHLYAYNSEAHRPSYVVIAFGELMFKGQLTKMKEKYLLFNNKGVPLRAEVRLEFTAYMDEDEAKKKATKFSPDMSRIIVVKEGDTLAGLCRQVYDNSLFVAEVARFNRLNSFRDISAGTKLSFPPLKKNS